MEEVMPVSEPQAVKPNPPARGFAGFLAFLLFFIAWLFSAIFWTLLYVCTFTWLLFWVHDSIRRAHRFLLLCVVLHYFLIKTKYTMHFNRAKVVFAAYPPERMWQEVDGMEILASWFFNEPVFALANLKWEGRLSGYILLLPPLSKLQSDPANMERVLQWVVDVFPEAQIALGGRLPAVCHNMNLAVTKNRRIVNGRVGTVALGKKGSEAGLKWLRENVPATQSKEKLRLCVLGGGGYTGKEIARACSQQFAEVYVVDIKFKPELETPPGLPRSVLGTSDPKYLGMADVILVFLAHGDAVEDYIEHARKEQVWIDDTHPPIPPSLRDRLMAKTNLYRLTAQSKKVVIFPPLPNLASEDLPGCLLTALVVAMNPDDFPTGAPLLEAKDGDAGVQKLIDLAERMGINLGVADVTEGEAMNYLGVNLVAEGNGNGNRVEEV